MSALTQPTLGVTENASDEVVWNCVKYHHARKRARGAAGNFNVERGNLLMRHSYKYSGTRKRSIHVKYKRTKKKQGEAYSAFEVIRKKGRYYRHPSKSEKTWVIQAKQGPRWRRMRKNKKTGEMEAFGRSRPYKPEWTRREIHRLTTGQLYRGDLLNTVQRRVWKEMHIRSQHKEYRRKCAEFTARQESDDEDDEESSEKVVNNEDLVEVD